MKCPKCGKKIPVARVAVVNSGLCVSCQDKLEKEKLRSVVKKFGKGVIFVPNKKAMEALAS